MIQITSLDAQNEALETVPAREVAVLVSGRPTYYHAHSTRSVEVLEAMALDLLMGDGRVKVAEGEAVQQLLGNMSSRLAGAC